MLRGVVYSKHKTVWLSKIENFSKISEFNTVNNQRVAWAYSESLQSFKKIHFYHGMFKDLLSIECAWENVSVLTYLKDMLMKYLPGNKHYRFKNV